MASQPPYQVIHITKYRYGEWSTGIPERVPPIGPMLGELPLREWVELLEARHVAFPVGD